MSRRMSGWLVVLSIIAFTTIGTTPARDVEVLVTKATLRPDRIVYRYTVVNGSRYPITGISIGFDFDHGTAELTRAPKGWRGGVIPDSSSTSPPGWSFELVPMQDGGPATADWVIQRPTDALAGGQTLSGFSIFLSAEDAAYEQGHWTAYVDTDEVVAYTGSLARAK
ncbi:MAG: hypothetical protein ACM3NF_02290 [Gemmatimonadota bacterium]